MEAEFYIALILTMICHASVAYVTILFLVRRKQTELQRWAKPETLIPLAERIISSEFVYEGQKTTLMKLLSTKIKLELIEYAKGPEAAAAMEGFIETLSKTIQDRIAKWAGGKITSINRQVGAGAAAAEGDLMGMVKQVIMQKVLGMPQVQQFLGGVVGGGPQPPAPPPTGGG